MGETRQTQRLSDAASGRAAGRLASRFSLTTFLRDQRGATAVEYGLIVACIFLAIIGGLSAFSTNNGQEYNKISTAIGGAVH